MVGYEYVPLSINSYPLRHVEFTGFATLTSKAAIKRQVAVENCDAIVDCVTDVDSAIGFAVGYSKRSVEIQRSTAL